MLGIFFVGIFLVGLPYYYFIFIAIFFLLVSFDVMYMEIPATVFHVAIFFAALFAVLQLFAGDSVVLYIISLVEAGAISVLLILVNKIKRAFGEADMLIFFYTALFHGIPFYVTKSFIATIILAGLFSIALVIVDRRWLKKYIPLLPFIFLGSYVILIMDSIGISFII